VPLFEALAQFSVAWPEFEHLVEALVASTLEAESALEPIGILEELVRDASICWAGFRGVPIPEIWASFAATRRLTRGTPPAERVLTFEIDVENAYRPTDPQLIVSTEEETDLWPLINGVAGTPGVAKKTPICGCSTFFSATSSGIRRSRRPLCSPGPARRRGPRGLRPGRGSRR